jgi:hypothetical protein
MRSLPCVLMLALISPVPLQAAKVDIPADQLVTAANGVSARCMARTTTKKDGRDWDFIVPVASDKEADFTGKGFKPAACGKLLSQLADHKRFVCEIAQGNEAVQEQTEAQLGIDARQLCAAVQRLLPDTKVGGTPGGNQ